MFEQILVPLDRSPLAECVLPHAISLARALNAQVVLLHVVSQAGQQNGQRAVDPFEWQLRRAEAESYLQSLADCLQEAGVVATTRVLDGDAAEQILECAREIGAGLVIISSHGQSGLSGWNVSSVVQKVIMRAKTSLLLVRAFQPAPAEMLGLRYERLLVPLDSSVRAESVLPLSGVLARAFESQVLLVHVVQRPAMPRRTPLSPEDSELVERVVERNSEEAEQYLDAVHGQLPEDLVETRLLVAGSVSAALHEMAEQEGLDLVILSAHGYSGQVRWPYGSLVTSFITYGSSPLLIFQDATADQIAPSHAELALQRSGRR